MEERRRDTTTDGKTGTVTITRNYNLRLEDVWKAWSEEGSLKKWWGPEGYTCTSCSIDFREGGKFYANMISEEGDEVWSVGKYTEIVPMKEIAYEDYFSDSEGNIVSPQFYNMPGDWSDVRVRILIEEVAGETRMTIQQTGIPVEMIEDCTSGWTTMLRKLDR